MLCWWERVVLKMGKFLEIELPEWGWKRHPERWWDLHSWRFFKTSPSKAMDDLIWCWRQTCFEWEVGWMRDLRSSFPANISVMWEHGEMQSGGRGGLSLPVWSHSRVISRFSNAKQLLPHSSYERRLSWAFSVRVPWEKAIAVWGGGIKLCHWEQRLKKPSEISRKKSMNL